MRIHGDNDPLDEVASRGERLWQPHAYLACGTRSRQPALIDTLRRLDVARGGVERDPKDCNTAERPLDRLSKPELDRMGRLGDHGPRRRQRLDQGGMQGRDTVGQPPSTEIGVLNMPSLKAKKLRKLPREKVLLEL